MRTGLNIVYWFVKLCMYITFIFVFETFILHFCELIYTFPIKKYGDFGIKIINTANKTGKAIHIPLKK